MPLRNNYSNSPEARFIQEYVVDLNGTQAAIRAGYSPKTAMFTASRVLKRPHVAAAIAALQKDRAEKLGVTADRVVRELALLGFANMQDYMTPNAAGDPCLNFKDLTRDQAAALAEITVDEYFDGRGDDAREVKRVKFKLSDKRAALVDLGKYLGLFKERIEASGPGGGPIQTEEIGSARDFILKRLEGMNARVSEKT